MTIHPDIQVLLDAGLRPMHLTRLLPATRTTIYKWVYGKAEPNFEDDTKQSRALTELAKTVREALEDGTLPVSNPHAALTPKEVADLTYITVLHCLRKVNLVSVEVPNAAG